MLESAQAVSIHNDELDAPFTYCSAEIFLTAIPDATIVAGWDFVIAPTGEVLRDSGRIDIKHPFFFVPHAFDEQLEAVAHVMDPDPICIDANVLFLSAPADYQFGHWMMAHLPRLRGLSALTRKDNIKIAIPHTLPQHHRDQLALFGVTNDEIIECEFRRTYKFKSLYHVGPFDEYRPSPNTIGFVYDGLGPRMGRRRGTDPKRIYLERAKGPRGRVIVNNDDLNLVLSDLGWETMRRPEIPLAEQNRILSEAELAVTVFGTDMLAIFQMQRGSDLLLLCPDYMVDLTMDSGSLPMAILCDMLGIRMSRILCATSIGESQADEYRRNLVVDPLVLRVALNDIFELRQAQRRMPGE